MNCTSYPNGNGIIILNISDKANPIMLNSTTAYPACYTSCYIAKNDSLLDTVDNYMGKGLYVYDIATNRAQPRLLTKYGQSNHNYMALALSHDETTVLMADYFYSLLVIKVSECNSDEDCITVPNYMCRSNQCISGCSQSSQCPSCFSDLDCFNISDLHCITKQCVE